MKTKMKANGDGDLLMDMAETYLARNGYVNIRRIYRNDRIKDNIILANSNNKTGLPILVEVMDASKVRSIPLNGVGTSKRARAKFTRLKETAQSLGLKHYRLDALWISISSPISYSHVMNLGTH